MLLRFASRSIRRTLPLTWIMLLVGAMSVRLGHAASLPAPSLAKLSPRLLEAVRATPEDSVTAWIQFADKGETSPGDLARRLAMAEAALSPRSLARRLRAHVYPLVDYADLPVNPDYVAGLVARGFAPCGASRWLNQVAVRVPAARLSAAAELPFVARLEPVERVVRSPDPPPAASLPPRPPATTEHATKIVYGLTQGQMSQIGVPDLHNAGYTGAGVLICVLDDGFNYFTKHEALRDMVVPHERQRDFLRGVYDVQDTLLLDPRDTGMQHGTWCLGVMAGRKFGTYVGAAFDAEYALGRTEVDSFERTQEMIYWGMGAEWADSLGADIISSSLGYSIFDSTAYNYSYANMDGHTTVISRAAQIAAQKGIVVVNAAGNEGNNPWHYITAPADVNGDSLIAAGAVDLSGTPAWFSSYGPSADGRVKPDLAACGVDYPLVSGTSDPNSYRTENGTSFATPTLAGLVACVMQARPQWTPRQVILALRSSASRHLSPDDRVGYGIPNGPLALDSTAGVPGGPTPHLSLSLLGANPVVFAHGPATFGIAFGSDSYGQRITLRVFDSQGRRVRELWWGVVSSPALGTGIVGIPWDGRDDDGRAVPSGLYIVDLRAGDEHQALRLAALR